MISITCTVIEIDEFGAAVLGITPEELKIRGVEFGDVVDLRFSSGAALDSIPYYNGFYVSIGEPVIVAYPSYKHPSVNYNCADFHEKTGVRKGDTVVITMRNKGGKLDVMNLRGVVYSNDLKDYSSPAEFANAREFHAGRIAPGKLYRCASPFDHQLNRPEAVDVFLKEHHIQTTFSISETEETLRDRYTAMPPYARGLYESGHVIPVGLGAGYFSKEFAEKLVQGLVRICDAPFPWAIHCLEGKDRTGFVCILLGSLMDADYDELLDDYMVTHRNYYRITKESDPVRYNGFRSIFVDTYLRRFAGLDEDEDPRGHSYRKGAEDYLRFGGMTDEQIAKLKAVLC